MEQQQQIYNYLIHPGTDIAELAINLTHTLHRLKNLLIISYGDGVTLAIRVAEKLQRHRIARKICVDLGFYRVDDQNKLPKIMILMSTVLVPECPLDLSPNYVINIDPFISWFADAYAALERGMILCLSAFGSSIPNLISVFVTRQDFLAGARISISTYSDEQNQEPSMEIKMQGSISMQHNSLFNSGPQCGLGPLPHYTGLEQQMQQALNMAQRHLFLPPQVPGHNSPPQLVRTAPTATTLAVAEPGQSNQRQEPRQTPAAALSALAQRQLHMKRNLSARNNAS